MIPIDPASLWNARYARRNEAQATSGDPWLERWRHLILNGRGGKILELGCGLGHDSRYLSEQGCDLIASDYSAEALRACRQVAPRAEHLLLDLRKPLPFGDAHFATIVASLCLHYFPWHQTVDIVTEIGRCLRPGGILLARLNSVRDKNHGACGYPEVEPGLFLVGRELKRFFGREDVARLFSSGWKIHALDELTVAYHAVPKVLWEVVLERTSDDSLPSSKND